MTVLQLPTDYAGDTDAPPDGAISADIVYAAGITFRQLDHWTRVGYLTPHTLRRDSPGYPRTYPRGELAAACLMSRLVAAGITPAKAHDYARDLLSTGTTVIAGITVHLPEEL